MIYNILLQLFPSYLLATQKGDISQIGKFEDFADRHAKL